MGNPGAPRHLAATPRAHHPDLLHPFPKASGFRGPVWTRMRVAEVRRVTGSVRYHPTPVGRLRKVSR
jgi:hypothetical protein